MAVVMEEHIAEDYVPTEKEIAEYAEWLGMNPEEDKELLWIARSGLKEPLPKPWKPCQAEDGEIFYFNFETGESVWDHPCDERYRRLYTIEHKKINGETLSKDDRKFLQSIGREDLVPCKLGSLVATLNDQGVVEVSALSMGGNAIAITKLKHPYVTFRSVQRSLNRQAGERLRLILLDGTEPEKDIIKFPNISKTLVRDIIELSNAEAWPTEPKGTDEKLKDLRKLQRKLPEMSKLTELPPLKMTKKHRFRQFGTQAQNSSVLGKSYDRPDPVSAI